MKKSKAISWSWREITLFGQEKKLKVRAPKHWSENAVRMTASKYLRKISASSFEKDFEEVFHRLAFTWTNLAGKKKYFSNKKETESFYDDLMMMLAQQFFAPNSPQWFNTGLYEIYGLNGGEQGHWVCDEKTLKLKEVKNSFERPQLHACFIQSVEDSLLGTNGIMGLWYKEARLFKFGSGSGTNFSSLAPKGALLEHGGESSGVLSFLKVGDRQAGVIQSGGTTRRAAKMVVLDGDHPDILDFINWKREEENKVSALICGSQKLFALEQYSRDLVDKKITQEEFVRLAKLDSFSQGLIDQVIFLAQQGKVYLAPDFDESFEGEAYKTVSGQNANHSVRLNDKFFKALDQKANWNLKFKSSKQKIPATELWESLCEAAWASGDPGLQFSDTINHWHTCKASGEIRASNPCSEYFFLDETACNLASLNLIKFYDFDREEFSLDLFIQNIERSIYVLDLSVGHASYPSPEIALRSTQFRTLGLGLTNMGALLMSLGLPYDSDEGRSVLQIITALMSAQAWKTSAQLSQKLGPFPLYKKNKSSVIKVLKLHQRAAKKILVNQRWNALYDQLQILWQEVISLAEKYGVRNAQTTLLAPTGTISFLMDCDTTGVEPDFALVKTKTLVGGGEVKSINTQVERGLLSLGYTESDRQEILKNLIDTGDLSKSKKLKPTDLPVFHCAREISPMGHLKMVAGLQPFLCGGISKTINLPAKTTIKEISDLYRSAHKLGVKSIALYRESSKLSAPYKSEISFPYQVAQTCYQCKSTKLVRVGTCFVCRVCGTSTSC